MSQRWSEEALFNEALQQPTAAARQAFLDAECSSDAALRTRLQRLLESHFAGRGFLEGDSSATDRPGLGGVGPLLSREEPGTRIGHYTLIKTLGEGGFGVVYAAEQSAPVRRQVALKIIKPGMDTRQVVARFEAERQALALMDHPHIAKVFDAGATEQGRPYFVMELVRGVRITEYCDAHALTPRQRIDLFIQVCQAIQHAHQKGIIHRDIKPSNILIVHNDPPGSPAPKIIDFGIAKATQGGQTDDAAYTRVHQFIGTPAYTSPEQAEAGAASVDTRSDIYSLGVLLYELLTGHTPFDGRELASLRTDALRQALLQREPAPPSTKVATLRGEARTTAARQRALDPPHLIRQLRGDLDWIVLKCLEKDRTRRYETANGLAADLKRYLRYEPVTACPPSTGYRLRKTIRRHRAAFAASAAVVAALVLGLAASIGQAFRATRAEGLAARQLAESEAYAELLTDVFQSPDPARSGRDVTVGEILDAATQRLPANFKNQPARKAQMQVVLGRTYLALGLAEDAVPLLRQAVQHYRAGSEAEPRDSLTAMRFLGLAYYGVRRYDEAIALQEDLLQRHRQLRGAESSETIQAMIDLGNSYDQTARVAEAYSLRTEALRLSRKVNGLEHPDTVRALLSLSYSSAPEPALTLREEALALSRRVHGPEHPATFRAAYSLQLSYAAMGREAGSLKLLQELVPFSQKINGPDHILTRRALDSLERAYYTAGRWQDAMKLKADYARWDARDLNAELLAVQAWFGREAEYAETRSRLLKWAENTSVPTTAERAAKASLLLPLPDAEAVDRAWTLARRAVEGGRDHQFLGWFQLALGMAEYRRRNYVAAEHALLEAQSMAPLNSGFFRAMSLYQRGQVSQARDLFQATAKRMRPLPDDHLNPLAGGASGDDIIVWLAYREAKALLGMDEPSGLLEATGPAVAR
jgi:serine/threonine protein kinase